MKIKGIIWEDFVNYKKPSMFIITCKCDFKCNREFGNNICQNMTIVRQPDFEIEDDLLITRYLDNPITKSIVFGGLEPFEQFDEVLWFIETLRNKYNCNDDVVIYTGFYPEEIQDKLDKLKQYENILIKFGRFIPNQVKHYDAVLGVQLISDNQYAEKIS